VVIWSNAPHMRPVDVNMISTDGCARDVMAITRMRFVQEAELGRAGTGVGTGRTWRSTTSSSAPTSAGLKIPLRKEKPRQRGRG
jgi:hypothetical protein